MNTFPMPRRRLLQLTGLAGLSAAVGLGAAACSGGGDEPGTGGSQAPNGRPAGPTSFPDAFPEVPRQVPQDSYGYDDTSAPVTMSLLLSGAFNGPRPKDPIKAFLEQKFNAKIRKLTSLTSDDMRNKAALTFTSGDAADFILIPARLRDITATLLDQGQLAQGRQRSWARCPSDPHAT